MEPRKFLKEKLEKLAATFPHVHIKYAYNYSIATYVVELTPEGEYYNNADLDNAWIPISIEFDETFLADDICFISSDSRLAVTTPEMEWNKPPVEWDMPVMNKVYTDALHSPFDFEFPTTVNWEAPGTNLIIGNVHPQHNPITGLAISVTVQNLNATSGKMIFNFPKEAGLGSTQYAMAA